MKCCDAWMQGSEAAIKHISQNLRTTWVRVRVREDRPIKRHHLRCSNLLWKDVLFDRFVVVDPTRNSNITHSTSLTIILLINCAHLPTCILRLDEWWCVSYRVWNYSAFSCEYWSNYTLWAIAIMGVLVRYQYTTRTLEGTCHTTQARDKRPAQQTRQSWMTAIQQHVLWCLWFLYV